MIEILTDTPRPRKYWNSLKTNLKEEGSEVSQKLGQLKMKAQDGKMRIIDVVIAKNVFLLIKSIP